MFDLMATKKGRVLFFLAALFGGMLGNIIMSAVACQPPSPNTSPQPAATAPTNPGASLVRDVVVTGSGNVRASMTLDLGIMVIPLHLDINAHADPGGAGGTLDVGVEGLLEGRCKLVGGVGECAAAGALVPRAVEPAPALTAGGEDATP